MNYFFMKEKIKIISIFLVIVSWGVFGIVEKSRAEVIFSDNFNSGNFNSPTVGLYGYVSPYWLLSETGGRMGGYAYTQGGHPLHITIPEIENHLELYIRFYTKVVDSTKGQKWLKIFGDEGDDNGETIYANTTFGRTYSTGMFGGVSFGSLGCTRCDTQNVLNYPDGQWFPNAEWTYYEAHIKFASAPDWNNGMVEVWYGDEVKISAGNVDNRNSNHEGLYINHISISDYAADPDADVGYMMIDDLVVATERIGDLPDTIEPSAPINLSVL